MHSWGVKLCNASPTAVSNVSTVRAAMRSRIDLIFEKGFSIGLKAGDCGRSDEYAGAGDKPTLNRLLGVSANFRFPLTVCLPESARARLIIIFLK